MRRFMKFPGNVSRALTLSYDDGVDADIRLMNILDKKGIKCTFNINSALFAPEGTVYPEGQAACRMTLKQIIDTYKNSGHEVAVHASTHAFLDHLTTAEVVEEVISDRKALENIFSTIIRGMAYPFGTFNDTVVDALKSCGIAYSRTTVSTHNFNIPTDWLRMGATCHHADKQLFELCDKFFEEDRYGRPRLFYLWGHSYEFNAADNWDTIERFAEKMGGRDDVWYATNIEIYDYIQAYNSMQVSADGKIYKNVSSQNLYFVCDGIDYMIKSGETLVIE